MYVPAGALGGQQALDLLELEPQVVVSHLMEVLGPKPGFSVIAVRTVNSWAFLQPSKDFWLFFLLLHFKYEQSIFIFRQGLSCGSGLSQIH